jgi:hypothetical protein
LKQEICKNPFRKSKCESTDIYLYIEYKGDKLPICKKCWDELGDSDYEWGSHEYEDKNVKELSPEKTDSDRKEEEEDESNLYSSS